MTQERPSGLRAYRALTGFGAPVLDLLLKERLRQGKEDPARWREKRGESTATRPAGFLVWIHAVSVGEAMSALPLIDALLARNASLSVLITTGTRTSSQLLSERLPRSRAIHQFAPLDHPDWVRRFFDRWRPDLGLVIESELWPNLLLTAEARAIPMILVNARISERSAARWLKHPAIAGRLLRAFQLCLAQDSDTAARLCALGAAHVETPGNLKFAAPPLPDKAGPRAELTMLLQGRPRWLAASTHPGEEALIAEAHAELRRAKPGLLTLIVPRHPERGAAIAAALAARGLKVVRRAAQERPDAATDIYIGDTLGELGLFYRLSPIVFVGGTLVPIGGQNPLEPARLGCAVLHGPSTNNFFQIYERLDRKGAGRAVATAQDLAGAVSMLLGDEALRAAQGRSGAAVAATEADVLPRILTRLAPYLPPQESALHARS